MWNTRPYGPYVPIATWSSHTTENWYMANQKEGTNNYNSEISAPEILEKEIG